MKQIEFFLNLLFNQNNQMDKKHIINLEKENQILQAKIYKE